MCLLSGDRACVEVAIVDRHCLGRCALVALTNRSRAGASRGRSELTKAIRYYTDHGVRTILGMEYNREFYTTPQRYLTNVTPEQLGMAEDPTSEEIVEMGWKVAMNKALILPPADPVGYEQAAASFRSMMRMSDKQWQSMVVEGEIDGIAEFNSVTFDRLSGALGRLVLEPARKTVANNIAPGARFARVPEPGACAFCLMLASRGAVYSKDTAGMTEATRYHDHCRCIAIEVSERAPLPAVNRELEKAWDEATSGGGSHGDMVRQWKNHLERRSAVLQSQVRFPAIPGVKVPGYRGKPVTVALSDEGKELELPLPDLHQMPGHVLYGWVTAPPWGRKRDDKRSRQPGDYSLDRQYGHKAGNKAGKTSFPAEWTDQQIVNAVRDVLEGGETTIDRAPTGLQRDRQGNEWLPTYDYVVTKTAIIDGVEIKAMHKVVDGVAVQPYGFPVRKEKRK